MERVLTLHFIDGSKLSFDFPEQSTNLAAKRLKLADMMGKNLVIEAEGQVFVFPTSSIKYLALSIPMLGKKDAKAALPGHAILGARIRS
jgi:hypothetical protein